MPRFVDAVVGDTILRIVVGADFFRTHASANGAASVFDFFQAFLFSEFPNFGGQQLKSEFFVSDLGALVTGFDGDAGRNVG